MPWAGLQCVIVTYFFPLYGQEYLVVRSAEYALISHESREVCEPAIGSPKKCESYNIGLVILKDPQAREENKSSLQLQFYIVLTSQEKMFPHSTVESTALRSKSMHTSTSGRFNNFAEPINVEYIINL